MNNHNRSVILIMTFFIDGIYEVIIGIKQIKSKDSWETKKHAIWGEMSRKIAKGSSTH